MKVVQITDLHIGQEGEYTNGVDVRQNFRDILQQVKRVNADHLVLTGDLCYSEGDRSIYLWMKSLLDKLTIPYDLISGNHDNSLVIAEVFDRTKDLKNGLLYYKKELASRPCFFLDTEKGYLVPSQLEWLRKSVSKIAGPIIIFMHYPPVYGGVPYLDRENHLANKTAFQEIIFASQLPTTVFCGHFHVDKTIFTKNLLTHITPSCYVQFDWRSPTFQIDHHRIALREIIIEGTSIRSSLTYFEGNRF